MPRIIKFILFLILFGIFFEAGLLSSYTIVTSQPPDIGNLIDMQVSKISAIWENINVNTENSTQSTLKITNADPVAQALKSKGGIDGINLQTLAATTQDDTTKDAILVTITAMGYKEAMSGGNGTGGQIVITASETYSITATAMAKPKRKGVEVDVNSIQVTSVKKIYSQ